MILTFLTISICSNSWTRTLNLGMVRWVLYRSANATGQLRKSWSAKMLQHIPQSFHVCRTQHRRFWHFFTIFICCSSWTQTLNLGMVRWVLYHSANATDQLWKSWPAKKAIAYNPNPFILSKGFPCLPNQALVILTFLTISICSISWTQTLNLGILDECSNMLELKTSQLTTTHLMLHA